MTKAWFRNGLMALAAVCLWLGGVAAVAEEPVVIDGRSVADLIPSFLEKAESVSRFRVIPVEDQPFEQAVRARTVRSVEPVWHAQIVTRYSQRAVRRGEVLVGSYYIRGRTRGEEAPNVTLAFSRLVGEYESLLQQSVEVPEAWERREFKVVADKNYPRGSLLVGFHLGAMAQTVEVADFKLTITTPEPE